jgi:hypothetical protein
MRKLGRRRGTHCATHTLVALSRPLGSQDPKFIEKMVARLVDREGCLTCLEEAAFSEGTHLDTALARHISRKIEG